jgi:hypothetical protein
MGNETAGPNASPARGYTKQVNRQGWSKKYENCVPTKSVMYNPPRNEKNLGPASTTDYSINVMSVHRAASLTVTRSLIERVARYASYRNVLSRIHLYQLNQAQHWLRFIGTLQIPVCGNTCYLLPTSIPRLSDGRKTMPKERRGIKIILRYTRAKKKKKNLFPSWCCL